MPRRRKHPIVPSPLKTIPTPKTPASTTYPRHVLIDEKLQLFRRGGSYGNNYIYQAKIGDRWYQYSTKTDDLEEAKSIAVKRYYEKLELKKYDEPITPKSFIAVMKRFLDEDEKNWEAKDEPKNKTHVSDTRGRAKLITKYFWDKRKMEIQDVNYDAINEFVRWRKERPRRKGFGYVKNLSVKSKTIEGDYIILRKMLKLAVRQNWIRALPEFPKLSPAKDYRSWFDEEEYKSLIKGVNQHIKEVGRKGTKNRNKKDPRLRLMAEDLRDWILFQAHTGCRVGEGLGVKVRDCHDIHGDGSSPKDYMYVYVLGKTGRREIVALYGAVKAYHRLVDRHNKKSNDKLFTRRFNWQFGKLLESIPCKNSTSGTLRYDSRGMRRDSVSLRHYFACARLLYGNVDVFDLATQMGTSVKIIQNFYAKPLIPRLKREQLTAYKKKRATKLIKTSDPPSVTQ